MPGGNRVLYVVLHRELYGCIIYYFFFHHKLVGYMEAKTLKIDPYDPYVTHKVVNGKHFTIICHMYDLKLPHEDPKEATKMTKWLKFFTLI